MLTLNEIQEACKLVELEGPEVFKKVSDLYSPDAAQIITVAYLRFQLGSTKTFPPDPKINAQVEVQLAMNNIFGKFTFRKPKKMLHKTPR